MAEKMTTMPTPRAPAEEGRLSDPTSNVLLVLDAAIARQDDLRNQESSRLEGYVKSELNRVDSLREAADKRADDIMEAHFQRVTEVGLLRAEYQEKLAVAEAKRIDAIRSVDVNAVAVASERATQQAQVLASQVAQSAEALRTLVASTAATFAQQQQSLQTQITERLGLLERAQYETKGKESYSDPALAALTDQVKQMSAAQQTNTGKGMGVSAAWAVGIAAVTVVLALSNSRIFRSSEPAAAPQIIYVPQGTVTAPPAPPVAR